MKWSALTIWRWLRGDGRTRLLGRLFAYAKRYWKALWANRRTGRLRLVDSLGLGERRSVAVLEVEGRRFLIGATQHAVTLLGELAPCRMIFERAETMQEQRVQDLRAENHVVQGQAVQNKEDVA